MIFLVSLVLSLDSLGTLAAYSSEALPPSGIQVDQAAKEVKKKSKGRTPREKETEGTKAPNRFDPDTFIKSRYELNGQSLEVDTE